MDKRGNEIGSTSLMGSTKGQEEVGTEDRLNRKSLSKSKKGEKCYQAQKSEKIIQKTSTQRVSVTIEVLFHPRRQKSLLLLLKGLNFEERSASIASVRLLYLIHRCHLLPRSLQRQEI